MNFFTEKYISANIAIVTSVRTNFEKRYSTMPLLDKWVFIGILLDRVQRETTNHSTVLAFIQTAHIHRSSRQSFSCLWRARLPRIFPFTFYSGKQEGRDPRGCSNEISNSSWKLGRHWKWIERANNAEQGVACSSVKWRTDEWRRDLVVAFVPATGVDRGGLKQRGVEAHSDVCTEHDFTALTGDARNALDNPTSALDLLDPFPLSLYPLTLSPRDV